VVRWSGGETDAADQVEDPVLERGGDPDHREFVGHGVRGLGEAGVV
jgi:hypothetical protein